MSEQETYYNTIGTQIEGAIKGQLFGKTCYKTGTKAFVCFFKDCMVFKLNGDMHADALSLDGSELFDPSGKKRPMKEWVQVPYHYKDKWLLFAEAAATYVGN